jgi:hypothetical protein
VELPHAAILVEVGPRTLWTALLGPASPADGVQAEGTELVEREDPVGKVLEHLFDAIQLLVA